ncbi:6776_t:CDS:2, partial [Racocetra fulgida]
FHSDDPPGEIRVALEFTEHYVTEKFGSRQACQIIVITDGRMPQADEVSKDDHSKQTECTLQRYKKLLNRHLPSRVTKNHPKGEFTLEKEAILTQCLQLLGDTDFEEEDDEDIEAMDYEEEREDPEDYEDRKDEE